MTVAKSSVLGPKTNVFKTTVPKAWFAVIIFNFGALLFGYDTAIFGALQVTKSWLGTFGTKNAEGVHELSAIQQSFPNSVPWTGKLFGIMISEPLNDRFGYKKSILVACMLQCIGVVVEMVGRQWGVFCAGRTIVYSAIGYMENVVPLYIGEIVYPNSRGFFVTCYTLIASAAQIWANGAIQAISNDTSEAGWLIICGQQFIPVLLIMAGIKWCPDSPRWLLQKGRHEEALQCLASVRTTEDNQSGWVDLEIRGIQQTIEAERTTVHNSWLSLFRGNNLRRTIIAAMSFIVNQWTGNQFVGSYAPTLYVLLGLQNQAFVYTLIKSIVSLTAVIAVMLIVDRMGRRFVIIFGCFMQCIFLYLLAGMGITAHPSRVELHTMVAALQLFIFFCRASVNALAFLIPAEVSSLTLRKKTMAIGSVVDVIAAFVVTFTMPYLIQKKYANLSSKVGFIFGGFTTLYMIWAIFFLPELKNRSLEEVDELFEARLWAWQFSEYERKGLAGLVAHHQNDGVRKIEEEPTVMELEAGHEAMR